MLNLKVRTVRKLEPVSADWNACTVLRTGKSALRVLMETGEIGPYSDSRCSSLRFGSEDLLPQHIDAVDDSDNDRIDWGILESCGESGRTALAEHNELADACSDAVHGDNRIDAWPE